MSDNPYGLPLTLVKGEKSTLVHTAIDYQNLLGSGWSVAKAEAPKAAAVAPAKADTK